MTTRPDNKPKVCNGGHKSTSGETMPTTFRRILRDRAITGAAFLVGAIVTGAVLLAFIAPVWNVTDSDNASPSRVERLIERHDCWTGEAPDGEIPARAIVTLPGERARVAPSQVGFDIWLADHPGTLHAFCP